MCPCVRRVVRTQVDSEDHIAFLPSHYRGIRFCFDEDHHQTWSVDGHQATGVLVDVAEDHPTSAVHEFTLCTMYNPDTLYYSRQ